MLFFPLTRWADRPLHIISCKQHRSTSRLVSISTTLFPLPVVVPTFTVLNRIGPFPGSLSLWHEVAQTVKYSIIDATFIQYWGINFTVGCPSWHKLVANLVNWVFLLETPSHDAHQGNQIKYATCTGLHQYHNKGRDLRHWTLDFSRALFALKWGYQWILRGHRSAC